MMSIFTKTRPEQRPFNERAADFRKAIYQAMTDLDINGQYATRVLDDIVQTERMRVATTAPLPGSTRVYSGNIESPRAPMRALARMIAGR